MYNNNNNIFCVFFRLIRPVGNSSDRLTVKMGLKLSQIIGVDMKRQIMITNVWVEQVNKLDRSIRCTVFNLLLQSFYVALSSYTMIINGFYEYVNKLDHSIR